MFYAPVNQYSYIRAISTENKQEGEVGGGGGGQTACKVSELCYNDTMSDTEAIILGSILTIPGLISFPYFKYADSCNIGRGVVGEGVAGGGRGGG